MSAQEEPGDKKEDLTSKVSEWLNNEGYRLEHQTYDVLRRLTCLSPILSSYVDDENGNPREIDVSASFSPKPNPHEIWIKLLCECKYSKKYPWVLMYSSLPSDTFWNWHSTPKTQNLAFVEQIPASAETILRKCLHFKSKHLVAHTLLQTRFGKSKDDGLDQAYDAMRKICGACHQTVRAADRFNASPECDTQASLVVFPCIVVDAPLFVAKFHAASGDFVTEPATFGRVSWSGSNRGTMIDVVHVDALEQYAATINETIGCVAAAIDLIAEGSR